MSVRALHISHLVVASDNVPRMTSFCEKILGIAPHYSNDEFADFVLPSGTRIAFFKPTGKTTKYFNATSDRGSLAIGITVSDVNEFYALCESRAGEFNLTFSGPPKDHPWGETSFLMIDFDGNRWEITASPTPEGRLVNKPML